MFRFAVLALLAGCAVEGVEEPPLPPDQEALVVHELTFEDGSRDTPGIGALEGSDSRVIEVDVWVGPHAGEGADARALVVLMHGLMGSPNDLTGIARHLVAADMVVALLRFPVTAGDAAGSLGSVVDFPAQPGDSALLFGWLDPPCAFLGIPGAGHTDPIAGDQEPGPEARAATQEFAERWFSEHVLGESTDLAAWLASLDDYTTRLER
jgi:hypothetical protein